MSSVGEAIKLATEYHEGQMYGIHPYTYHLEQVATQVRNYHCNTSTEWLNNLTIVAWLHDILEDTSCEYETVGHTFGWSIADSVHNLTKLKGDSYEDYILRVKSDAVAREVKIADTFCNLNQSLLGWSRNRIMKYSNQLKLLVE